MFVSTIFFKISAVIETFLGLSSPGFEVKFLTSIATLSALPSSILIYKIEIISKMISLFP